MPEPTTTTAAVVTLAAAGAAVPVLTVLGIPLGLRADLLIAGFAGGLVAIVLLNSVPDTADTWREMVRLGLRRIMVAVCSALTAGYVTPLAQLLANVPPALVLGCAFAVGCGAQKVLIFVIRRLSDQAAPPTPPAQGGAAP